MSIGTFDRLVGMLGIPHLRTHLRLMKDFRGFARIHFLSCAIELGLLQALRQPRPLADLVEDLDVQQPEMFEGLLRLGVTLGDLEQRNDAYRLKSRDVRAIIREDGEPIAALIQEYALYHGAVYQELAGMIQGAPRGDYLEDMGPLIARSSRVFAPMVGNFVRKQVGERKPERLLEVGCGSGIYLKYAAEGYRSVQGIAIDLDPDVVDQARENLKEWGLEKRFGVVCGDIRQPPAVIEGPFDWISLYNNIYYFEPAERLTLYGQLREMLSPDGVLALVTMTQGDTLASIDFDLILQATRGCSPLPEMRDIIDDLYAAGFGRVEPFPLAASEPLYGLLADEG